METNQLQIDLLSTCECCINTSTCQCCINTSTCHPFNQRLDSAAEHDVIDLTDINESILPKPNATNHLQQYIIQFSHYNLHTQHTDIIHQLLHSFDVPYKLIARDHYYDNHSTIHYSDIPTDFILLQCSRLHCNSISLLIQQHQSNHTNGTIHRMYLDKQVSLDTLQHNINKPSSKRSITTQSNSGASYTPHRHLSTNTNHRALHKSMTYDEYGINSDSVVSKLNAGYMWSQGYSGASVKVAIFDTGLNVESTRFKHIVERSNWTDEPDELCDLLGHGTFVAGMIGSSDMSCPGFAPDSELYIFRVFNKKQLSYTSWFLDAFNYAIYTKIDILNLSIGGPDFRDQPFVDKINEMTANGIIIISAIGNDGPIYGTLNNPADQIDVIGVGGVDMQNVLSTFSSRGMTTHELLSGYGRVKPDIVTYANNLIGTALNSGCRELSGTSVASPVVTGIIALLSSVIESNIRSLIINPASIKQALVESSHLIANANIYEQGMGSIDIIGAYQHLVTTTPHASVIPATLDFTNCPYMWPFCTQSLYHTAQPLMFNMTVLNGMSLTGYIATDEKPRWIPSTIEHDVIDIIFSHSDVIWPYSGWLAIEIHVRHNIDTQQIITGNIKLTVLSQSSQRSDINIPVRLSLIPTPSRNQRILFDSFHNLRYPNGYFPRDNLDITSDTLDWHGDHIHTNYMELYTYLRSLNYYVEVLGSDYTCINSTHYGTLLVIDPEDEYFNDEINKLYYDITENGLSLLLLSDWYNIQQINQIKFYDENTALWWNAATGGSNVPAINTLLYRYGLQYTDHVYSGNIQLFDQHINYGTGTTIRNAPIHSQLLRVNGLHEYQTKQSIDSAVIGVYLNMNHALNNTDKSKSGQIVLYGDSNCVDMSHRIGSLCTEFIRESLSYTMNHGSVSELLASVISEPLSQPFIDDSTPLPQRMLGSTLEKYSHVINSLPQCIDLTAKYNYISDHGILYNDDNNIQYIHNSNITQQQQTQVRIISERIIDQHTAFDSILYTPLLYGIFVMFVLSVLGIHRYQTIAKRKH